MSNGTRPGDPASGSDSSAEPGSIARCPACTITSRTFVRYPTNRARRRIGVGEKVRLTVDPGPATWAVTSGTGRLSPNRGSHTIVTYTASDTAGAVTITATGSGCTCTITFTVVEPSTWRMTRQSGTNLQHTHGRPDCGWKGIMWVRPRDVNFYYVKTRELDSQYVGTGSSAGATGDWHGSYPLPDRASDWFPIKRYIASRGSTDDVPDEIYSGDDGVAVTGAAPPFVAGSGHFPITMQWKVRSGSAKNFPVSNQEDERFANGRCEMRKGGNTEHTMWNDPSSTY